MSDPYRVTIDAMIMGNVLSNSIKEIARLELASDEIDSSDAREGLTAKAQLHRQFANSMNNIMLAKGTSHGSVDDLVAMAKEDLLDQQQKLAMAKSRFSGLVADEPEEHQCDSFLCDRSGGPELSEESTPEPESPGMQKLMDMLTASFVLIIPRKDS
jgi:hypothetical protein